MCEPTTALMIATAGLNAVSEWSESDRQEALNDYNTQIANQTYSNNMASLSLANQELKLNTSRDLDRQGTEALRANSAVLGTSGARGVGGTSLDNAIDAISKQYNVDQTDTRAKESLQLETNAIKGANFDNQRSASIASQPQPKSKIGIILGSGLNLASNYYGSKAK